ncbi:hypothetical protein Dsin_001760 [Dipteronia sinensis]|uniref:DUF4283 domain-containing protein n=1 Tax=Dipteronia sinensis TaxID=43782 RepID=A0AAE0B691_9ROSI|nr:hypothetical protein Dsin_001760 [Dipteronia sinensis]
MKGAHHGPNKDTLASKLMNLKFYQHFQSGNRRCVSPPPMEVVEDGSKAWKNWLVGYFIEKKLSFSLVNNIAMRIWGNRGLVEVLANDKGFYFFKFLDDEACYSVLESGPLLFAGRMVILKKWHPKLILTKESYFKIPVWVKLFIIPHEYWTEEGLSHIASAVGKPLHADSLTESMKRISYARICIEIDATCDLVDSFDLFMGDKSNPNHEESVEILVENRWKPKICSECKSFGHSIVTCLRLKPLHPPSDTDFAPKPNEEWRRVNRRVNPLDPSPQANLEPPPLATLKGDEVIPTYSSEIEPSSCPTILPIHNKSNDLLMESVVDTFNKFSALDEDGNYCNDDESPSIASPDQSLWHSKIKKIDRVTIIGLSSLTESSSNNKKKKK